MELIAIEHTGRGYNTIWCEESPGLHPIFYTKREYMIPLPWMYYQIDTGPHGAAIRGIGIRPEMVESVKNPVYQMPVPNMYAFRPCYYGGFREKADTNVIDKISHAYIDFWNGQSNKDSNDYLMYHPAVVELMGGASRRMADFCSRLSKRPSYDLPYDEGLSRPLYRLGFHHYVENTADTRPALKIERRPLTWLLENEDDPSRPVDPQSAPKVISYR